jgi:hypothetical protein
MVYSHLLKREMPNNPSGYWWHAAQYVGRKAISNVRRFGTVRGRERTTELVRDQYDANRGALEIGGEDEFILGTLPTDFAVFESKVQYIDPQSAVRERMKLMYNIVSRYVGSGAVLELGAGHGRNLLSLRRAGLNVPLVGFELSPVSVDLARRASRQFGYEARFETVDVTLP